MIQTTRFDLFRKITILTKTSIVLNLTFAEPSDQKTTSDQSIPGLHVVANFTVASTELLLDYGSFKTFIEQQIAQFNLTNVGEVYHNFPGGGYTGVVCLTESHLSIHTWPEQKYLTFDIFLSNYLKDNRTTTLALYKAVRDFFSAEVVFEKIINR